MSEGKFTAEHEFVEVRNRRWCLGCDLFQQKPHTSNPFPTSRNGCPENTPRANLRKGNANVTA